MNEALLYDGMEEVTMQEGRRTVPVLGVMTDAQIQDAQNALGDFITPFLAESCRVTDTGLKIISKGLSSYGYDATLGDEVLMMSPDGSSLLDPKAFPSEDMIRLDVKNASDGSRYVILPAGAACLAHTMEVFNIPDNVFVTCMGKSTYARCFMDVTVTPLEPGWRGQVTLEIKNNSPYDSLLYIGEGICQFEFKATGLNCPNVTYADRNGKYQDQSGVTLPKV